MCLVSFSVPTQLFPYFENYIDSCKSKLMTSTPASTPNTALGTNILLPILFDIEDAMYHSSKILSQVLNPPAPTLAPSPTQTLFPSPSSPSSPSHNLSPSPLPAPSPSLSTTIRTPLKEPSRGGTLFRQLPPSKTEIDGLLVCSFFFFFVNHQLE